ncbi:uncharacterized protein LOC111132914 isoform X2 [Crassostrea virginica]|uniref:Uncharacterized protein LOC111132914 isoform X2 n=1 Tax=Crassostrea virginica TaxID=6565 RepID=A0A8B8E7E2_CRAVI|nr:uncharacterized protein LOC111132914 isoform X2 [Crassostrea virginica]
MCNIVRNIRSSFISVCYGGDTCSSIYKGTAVSKYCEIGGCCIPDTVTDKTDPDELCCVTTLTVILVASFVGGPVLIMTIVCSGVCIKRYCERKKNDDRVHEAENARQERRRERRRQREQQDREEEAIRIRRYYDPKPEDGPLAPPAYSDGPPGSVPGRRALPMSPPPAYEAIIQENTLPNRRGQNAAPSQANGDVPHSGGEHIDVTIHAPAIAGRRTNKRVTMKETVENITIARQVLKRMEPVPKNQVSPSNSFRAAPSPVRANNTVPNGHVTFQPNTTPARPMSRPRQVVSDAPAEEPADLEYI